VWNQVWKENIKYESFSSYGNIWNYGWASFYDFFNRIGIFKHDGFEKFCKLIKSGVYDMIQLEGVCVYCGLPSEISRNNNGLHNVEKEAVVFKDGYKLHYVNGVYIKPELFQKLLDKEYTFTDFVSEENEEIKAACLSFMEEKWGSEYLYDFLSSNLLEVDTYVDKKDEKYMEGTTRGMNIGCYTLFKGSVEGIDLAFVRCYCPSTDRMFFLGVDPDNTNAKDSIASLYRVPRKLKDNIAYIQRQGERYSTVFNCEIELTKEETEDLVSLTGDAYFSLIKYEY